MTHAWHPLLFHPVRLVNILSLLFPYPVTTNLSFELPPQPCDSLLRLLSRCFQLHQVRPPHVRLPLHLSHLLRVSHRASLQRGDALLNHGGVPFEMSLQRGEGDAAVLQGADTFVGILTDALELDELLFVLPSLDPQ